MIKGRGNQRRKSSRKTRAFTEPTCERSGNDGYDWGWPFQEAVSANLELATRLGRGGFTGCGYGLLHHGGPPFLALLGEDLAGMRSALLLMHEWVRAIGPNAISVEIMFDGPGYRISIGQQPDLLRWRLSGIDSDQELIVLGMGVTKGLDTRHPFLENLAAYSRQPVAPVHLIVAAQPVRDGSWSRRHDTIRTLSPEGNGILLPGIRIYTKPEERPPDAMVMLEREEREVRSTTGSRVIPGPATDPGSVAARRGRRLLAAMPKTLQVLRNRSDGRAFVSDLTRSGCRPWQVEQAVANLRLASFLSYEPRGKSKRASMLQALRADLVEPASACVDLDRTPARLVLSQADLDAGFLLRMVDDGRPQPLGLRDRTVRLSELGYA